MIANPTINPVTPEEFLAWEAEQESKYEYENGKIIAMTGGTLAHSRIITNLASIINPRLHGTNCKAFVSDAKVKTPKGRFYYPDLVVSCDERDRFANDYLQYPKIIVEVLSPSTESRDRGIKQQHYILIDTLEIYMLVTPEYPRVEVYKIDADDCWRYWNFQDLTHNCDIDINNLGYIPMTDIYDGVNFPYPPE